MKKTYLSRNYRDTNSAGGKAKTDIERIIHSIGYRNIAFGLSQHKNKIVDFTKNFNGVIKCLFSMPRKGVVFLQYPMKKYYSFICKIAHLKNTKVVTVIHDLGTFRRQKLNATKEINRLNGSDYIIAQNPSMLHWLKTNGYDKGLGVLEIFDYLSDTENVSKERPTTSSEKYVVNYAGALAQRKNSFLYEMDSYINSFEFRLYGNGFTGSTQSPDFKYKGFLSSDEFISTITGDFGLVWDGDSLDTCSGNFGVYLKYNTPHKISFYIRSHLPVIIWKEAAMAPFIEKEELGFTISSLKELDDILADFPIEKYNRMKRNVIATSKKLKEGHFISKAVNTATDYFEHQQ